MRLMSGDIMLMSGESGNTDMHILGEVKFLKLNLFSRLYFECLVKLAFLRQTLLQCWCNSTRKLMESAFPFAGAKNI